MGAWVAPVCGNLFVSFVVPHIPIDFRPHTLTVVFSVWRYLMTKPNNRTQVVVVEVILVRPG